MTGACWYRALLNVIGRCVNGSGMVHGVCEQAVCLGWASRRKERTASEQHHICESEVFCCFAFLHIPSCWLIADLLCILLSSRRHLLLAFWSMDN